MLSHRRRVVFSGLFLSSLIIVGSVAMGGNDDRHPTLSAWMVEWDGDAGLQEAAALSGTLDSLSIFAIPFDERDRPITDAVSPLLQTMPPVPAFLTVVNDVRAADGNVVLKDPDLVTRFLASRESRDCHRAALLALVEGDRFAGLELDYERIRAEDWAGYLAFCREMAEALSERGQRLRVVLEPKPVYFRTPLPPGPEYSIMAYNLHGPHSGPGPKATPAFLARLGKQCREAEAQARLAVATGGFVWRADGKTVGVTEAAAAAAARTRGIVPDRDPESRYLRYRHEEGGVACETWYADGTTLEFLLAAAADHGFSDIDVWRLGGMAPETLGSLQRRFSRRDGQTWRISPGGTGSLGNAIACAAPGDSIVLEPGEYRERIRIVTPGLTIQAASDPEGTGKTATVIGTVRDGMDTLWQGLTFRAVGDGTPLLELDGFSGRFEKCYFGMEEHEGEAAIRIHAGRPVFSRCVFRGGGNAPGVFLHSITIEPVRPRAISEFAYCLFTGFRNDVAEITEEMDLRFANCLFTGNGRILRRFARFRGAVEMVNSVFFCNTGQFITNRTAHASPVRIANCLTTPYITPRFGTGLKSLRDQPGVAAEDCLTAAPRFSAEGRRFQVNLGIDEGLNMERFPALARLAGGFAVPLTFAVETAHIDEDGWRVLTEAAASGHEIASLTADRVATQPEPPLAVGYLHPGGRATSLDVKDGRLLVYVDDAVLGEAALDDETITGVSRVLRRSGVQSTASPHFSAAPAVLLAQTDRLDIGYPAPSVPLFLDAHAYSAHEIADSATTIKERIPDRPAVLAAPYGVASPRTRTDAARAGFAAVRTGIGLGDDVATEMAQPSHGAPAVAGVSLTTVRAMVPDVSFGENFRMALAYAAETLPAISFHTARPDDISPEEWREIFTILSGDETIIPATLADIAETHDGRADPEALPGMPGAAFRYRPVHNSPLVGRGQPLGFVRDYAGQPLPLDKPPSIGLFEPE